MENNMEKISHMLQAKLGCIWINSLEEMRVIDTIREIAFSMLQKNTKVEVNLWSITEGVIRLAITDLDIQETNEKLKNPLALLDAIKSSTLKSSTKNITIWVLRDFGKVLGNRFPDVYRELRDIKEYGNKNTSYNPIIAINVGEKIPQEVEPLFYVMDFDRLEKKEIETIMNDFLFSFSKNKKKLTPLIDETELSRIASALNGLTFQEIASIVKLNMEYENTLSYDFVLKEKIKLIKKTEVLDYIISETTLDDVGGNENFKEWIDFVKASFDEDAKQFGCRRAKGYLSLGIPGTAKSILAEALSNYLGFPFIRFDISKILCRFVGESEKNIENALRLVKASAPCVFLLDEVEKILGSTNSNSTDGGTTSRVVSSILQFLNEDTGVITVMTSNDISQLPPELTRPGRLDKVW